MVRQQVPKETPGVLLRLLAPRSSSRFLRPWGWNSPGRRQQRAAPGGAGAALALCALPALCLRAACALPLASPCPLLKQLPLPLLPAH